MINIQQVINSPLFKMIGNSNNPTKMLEQIINQSPAMKNNQLIQNCLQMMENGNAKGVENIARNLIKENGGDPDAIVNVLNSIKR